VVEESAAPIVLNNPALDEVIVAPRVRGIRRIRADLAIARRLRAQRFDLAIDLHGGPRSAWFARLSGARERIGYRIKGRSWMYTRLVSRPRELRPRHSVLNQWDLLEAIPGWPGVPPDPDTDPVDIPVDPAADRRVATRLVQAGLGRDDTLILVHVSAGNPFRRWPEKAFVDTVAGLAAGDSRRRIIVSSGPSDRDAAARIAAAARSKVGDNSARILDAGEFDLDELRALIGRSHLFIGGDTGPLHIAASTMTPVVGIYGPTLAARSAPWRSRSATTISVEIDGLPCRPCDQRACVPGDYRCLTTLSPSTVLAAAEAALK
jgi:ADP-heptose:LPS heptosyltransferase